MSSESVATNTDNSATQSSANMASNSHSTAWRDALLSGFELGNRYQMLPNFDGNRGLNGTMFRQRAGSSLEFLEHRDYQPGDDLRHIDWSVMAKRDQVYVKCFEQESTPVLDLVLDHSQSMNLVDSEKAAGTLKLVAAVTTAARAAHFHVKIWLAGSSLADDLAADPSGGCHLFQTPNPHPASWPIPDFCGIQNLADAFQERLPSFRPQGFRILISDLLFDADPTPIIQQFSQQSQSCLIIQVLADADITPPSHGSVRIIDSESNETQTVFIDADLQKRYTEAFNRHQSRWIEAASRQGCRFVPMIAESLIHQNHLKELEEMQILVPS